MEKYLLCTVDPGLSGAICFANRKLERVRIFDMPVLHVERGGKNKREIDYYGLAAIFLEFAPYTFKAYIERVGAMPGQGSTSMFAFGTTFGAIKQAVASAGIPQEKLEPTVWKKRMQVRKGKEGTFMRASEVLPNLSLWWPQKKNEGRATSALMNKYAWTLET